MGKPLWRSKFVKALVRYQAMTTWTQGGRVLKERTRWMRAREAAEILEVTPQRVSQMCKDRTIPHYRLGKSIKIDRDEFERWLKSRRQGPEL